MSEIDNTSKDTSTPASESTGEARPFSRKIESLAANPRHRGAFFTEDATANDLALVTAKYKDIKVYWLVDPQSDLIYDSKFFSYGGPISMAMGEILSSLVKGMKIDTACDISLEEIESLLRDEPGSPAIHAPPLLSSSPPPAGGDVKAGEAGGGAFANLLMLLATAKESYPAAKALALASVQLKQAAAQNPPGPRKTTYESLTEADQAWLKKSEAEQLLAIEDVLDRDIRPGLNSDGGDLQIVEFEEGSRLKVKYQGACGSCGSSVGATLSFIEDTMRRQLFGGFQVVPVETPDTFKYMSPPQ